MRALIGVILAALLVWLVGALVAWDLNPGNWNSAWRFICLVFLIGWGAFFGITGAALDSAAKDEKRRKLRTPTERRAEAKRHGISGIIIDQ